MPGIVQTEKHSGNVDRKAEEEEREEGQRLGPGKGGSGVVDQEGEEVQDGARVSSSVMAAGNDGDEMNGHCSEKQNGSSSAIPPRPPVSPDSGMSQCICVCACVHNAICVCVCVYLCVYVREIQNR